jgi:hypothetical protein
MHRAGRDYVVIEQATSAGSFFEQNPRQRKLISLNKRFTGRKDPEFNLRHDWCVDAHLHRNNLFGEHGVNLVISGDRVSLRKQKVRRHRLHHTVRPQRVVSQLRIGVHWIGRG